ncbi:unnamed protein product [Ceratitis capitata]|uniref:(Mediterranean fruit fly) hypothetical protein n=1 Tax=Ceratitis capitata TaxID=7213 RepID=A0A811V6L5_CERCA|nr:unnamed protein product [Ceratitis capitata]
MRAKPNTVITNATLSFYKSANRLEQCHQSLSFRVQRKYNATVNGAKMFNFYKLFVVLAALLGLTVARPSLLTHPVLLPSAISHQSITQIHAHRPVLVATPIITAVHPIVTHPIVHTDHILLH